MPTPLLINYLQFNHTVHTRPRPRDPKNRSPPHRGARRDTRPPRGIGQPSALVAGLAEPGGPAVAVHYVRQHLLQVLRAIRLLPILSTKSNPQTPKKKKKGNISA